MYGDAREHVARLIKEIAQIREDNTAYLESSDRTSQEKEAHENRERRLVEILGELRILAGNVPTGTA
jgi:hypothetical protein